jgi:hypothetical protein
MWRSRIDAYQNFARYLQNGRSAHADALGDPLAGEGEGGKPGEHDLGKRPAGGLRGPGILKQVTVRAVLSAVANGATRAVS